MRRGITAEIDLGAAAHNLKALRVSAQGLPVIAVVKADAYGHGAAELSRAFRDAGASALAVAFVSEARELRECAIGLPIIVLFESGDPEGFFDLGLTPVLHSLKSAGRFSSEAARRKVTLDVHVKVDTGMGRMGLDDPGDVEKIAALPGLRVSGLMSHLSEADLKDRGFVDLQLSRFQSIRAALSKKGITPACHLANSAAVLSHPATHLDAVRPGLALYGVSPLGPASEGRGLGLRPVMGVKARIAAIRRFGRGQPVSYARAFITRRETVAAVVACGYADGYMRALSNNSSVLIRGRRAPVMGRVCMDLFVADVTEAEGVSEDDEAVLMGSQGGSEISAWDLAGWASTLPYEVLTSLGRGSTRTFSGG